MLPIAKEVPAGLVTEYAFQSLSVSRLRARLRRDSEGSALVELALTLPIVFLIMTGIFAFSVAFYQDLALAEGVSVGGRTIAADRGMDTDPCKAAATAISAAAPTLSQSGMNLTFVINGTTVVNGVAANKATCSGTSLTANTAAEVEATYPCFLNVYGWRFSSACKLGSAVTENIQ